MQRAINRFLITTLIVLTSTPLFAQPTLETYGNLPTIKSMAMAPGSEQLGYITRQDENEAFLLFDMADKQVMGGARTGKIKTRYVSFAGPNHALLHASQTLRSAAIRGKLEYTAAYSYGLKTKKIKQLLRNSDDLYPFQSGIGRIIGLHEDGKRVFMPAFIGSSKPVYSVMRVDLDSGRGFIHQRGNQHTDDWLVDTDGTILAREDYDEKKISTPYMPPKVES